MAFYHTIKRYDRENQKRIAQRLLDLRASLAAQIGSDRTPGSLIIGSWNIRAFDGGRPRLDESYHYIAEIIGQFDICAVQEVKSNLQPLERITKLLGPNWDYLVTDVSDGTQGNSERLAYLFNKSRISFRNLVGELVIEGEPIARTPFFAAFQCDWFKFVLCNAHITFGDQSERVREISAISKVLKKRSKAEKDVYIFLGDMNIDTLKSDTMTALLANGMTVPLFGRTNLAKVEKHFDQIAFTLEGIETDFIRHGVIDWRDSVFKDSDIDFYEPIAIKQRRGKPYADWSKQYSKWTTNEMSDHLPIWLELRVDYSDKYLTEKFL
jgi:endonuclease/exonuclease/phosphatase family metal-dependent hydrolase